MRQDAPEHLLRMDSVADAADYVGDLSREQQEKRAVEGKNFEASFIIGGQVKGSRPEILMIYPEGNHITTSKTPDYLQIGESKYGKPILDRVLAPELIETSAMAALVSMDSTMRSNLGVGPPIELLVYRTDALQLDAPPL